MKKIYKSFLILGLIVIFIMNSQMVFAEYSQVMPKNFTAKMVLKSGATAPHKITREIEFKNKNGKILNVSIYFGNPTMIAGKATYNGTIKNINDLSLITTLNNRTYWDKMYLANNGGSTTLEIDTLEVSIDYENKIDNSGRYKESKYLIGKLSNVTLNGGIHELLISNYIGRRQFIMDFFNMPTTIEYYKKFPLKVSRDIIYDLGKSGTDNDINTNPKYGGDNSLCSETVSWYYADNNITVYDYVNKKTVDFKNIDYWRTMKNIFQNSRRMYSYHNGYQKWIFLDENGNWIYGKETTPLPGDYVSWDFNNENAGDGHAIMVLDWNADTKWLTYIDGPGPVSVGKVNVQKYEKDYNDDFNLGRIPGND
ncbi:MAG: hypothetical protein ABF289_15615 [Clostridiales bacterium]